ncbi:acyl-CoA thioesterase [Nocardia ignorata]|uniref:Acyl-CoA thioester hydrolase n=1 Tax=Nocardia ignorata TaxID=145285 RepID=A0A4R6PV34_NOCIG|nr:acyl-CoA thioesterase [Nocardia ignorata]TDP41246.1 acyl-CoA thioester hydrolase [Nocardia ignorata]
MTFSVPVLVRGYELDTQGHLNHAVYHQYGEHARWELLRAAGIPQDKFIASGIGAEVLESTIKYKRELRGGDEVTVTCAFDWRDGEKVFRFHHQIIKLDGTVAAEITVTAGAMDLTTRRLVADPAGHFRSLAENPDILGL